MNQWRSASGECVCGIVCGLEGLRRIKVMSRVRLRSRHSVRDQASERQNSLVSISYSSGKWL